METWIKLNNQTAGRDKLARLLQYLSRVLWHRLHQNHKNGVNNFKSLEYQLSTFRKLLRFGRSFETLYATLPLFQHHDTTIRSVLILSRISQALFLLTDHLLWLGRADVCSVNTDRWSRLSNKYWLYSITLNLVRDVYEISKIFKSQKHCILPHDGCKNLSDVAETALRVFSILQHNRAVMIDTVKNGCDFFIPLTALGHVKLSPGAVGWLGVVSSIAGLLVLVEPSVKLTPS